MFSFVELLFVCSIVLMMSVYFAVISEKRFKASRSVVLLRVFVESN